MERLEPSLLGRPRLDHSKAWSSFPFVVFDLETTGVDPLKCMPVSVAAVRFEGGVQVGEFYSTVNPGIPIPHEATEIHGITDAEVADAPPLHELAAQLFELGDGALPVGYNTDFDRPILHRFVAGTDCPLFDPWQRWLCVLVAIRDIDKYVAGTGRHKLANVCKRYGVELPNAHNALGDCTATGRLLLELARRGKIDPECPLDRLLAHVSKRRYEQQQEFDKYKARMAAQDAAAPKAEQQELPIK